MGNHTYIISQSTDEKNYVFVDTALFSFFCNYFSFSFTVI